MRLFNLLAISLFVSTALTAGEQLVSAPQGLPQEGRARPGEVTVPTGVGRSLVTPGVVPTSLEELVKNSDVIVEGVVQTVLPGRLRTPSDGSSVETDSIFTVRRVLKGRPESLRTLVITQIGGKVGDFELVPVQYNLLREGDHHVLFLTPDNRPILPTYPSVDGNFTITGIWSGNFKVENSAIRPSPRAMPELKKLEAENIDLFANRVLNAVHAGR